MTIKTIKNIKFPVKDVFCTKDDILPMWNCNFKDDSMNTRESEDRLVFAVKFDVPVRGEVGQNFTAFRSDKPLRCGQLGDDPPAILCQDWK